MLHKVRLQLLFSFQTQLNRAVHLNCNRFLGNFHSLYTVLVTKFEGQQVIWKYFLSCRNNSRSFKIFIDKLENDQTSCKKIRIELKISCTLSTK